MEPIPYARPYWDEDEITAVTRVIRSGQWTNGPVAREFEGALASRTGVRHVVCVSSGTAALHAFLHILRRRSAGRALYVTSSLNFAAGASAARLLGYDIALTDVDPATLNMSPNSMEDVLRATAGHHDLIVVNPVHYAGVLADMPHIAAIAAQFGALLFEDACHAVGRDIATSPSSLGAVLSFHPTKNVAAGEGGAIATNDDTIASDLRTFCNHSMVRTGFAVPNLACDEHGLANPWYYEIAQPGMNFRLSELHAAVGLCQVRRLEISLARRREIANRYWQAFADNRNINLYPRDNSVASDLHLFPVEVRLDGLGMSKAEVFAFLGRHGIVPQVHYTPLHRLPAFSSQPYVRDAQFVQLDAISKGLMSLPMYLGLRDDEVERVIAAMLLLCGDSNQGN